MALINQPFRHAIRRICFVSFQRNFAEHAAPVGGAQKKGLVLGVYSEGEGSFKFTTAATAFNKQTGGRLEELLKEAGGRLRKGKVQVYHNVDPEFFAVALAGVGPEEVGLNTLEYLDEAKENVRVAAGAGAFALRRTGVDHILVEGFHDVEAAAEGAGLAVWRFQDYKAKEDQRPIPTLDLHHDPDKSSWLRGINKAEAQNLARKLSDSPPNLMTPALFAKAAVEELCPCGVTVQIRDKEWIESKNMTAFLAAAKGSCELPILLELGYCGGGTDDKPIVLVGKGVTFDSGGLCLKRKCKRMSEYRADMSGGAVIVATLKAIAMLNLPINVTGVIPLCENMPSGLAVKPGDLVTASNGRTILVDNPDHEGQLILADALLYGVNQFKPKMVMDIATISSGMRTAVNCAASGAFCSNDGLWHELKKSGAITGDRVWRFPLWSTFTKKVSSISAADMTNQGFGPGGDPCLAAAFLREFVPCGDWIHLDITGSGMLQCRKDVPYLVRGRMTGRPTRTIIQFLTQMVNYDPSASAKQVK